MLRWKIVFRARCRKFNTRLPAPDKSFFPPSFLTFSLPQDHLGLILKCRRSGKTFSSFPLLSPLRPPHLQIPQKTQPRPRKVEVRQYGNKRHRNGKTLRHPYGTKTLSRKTQSGPALPTQSGTMKQLDDLRQAQIATVTVGSVQQLNNQLGSLPYNRTYRVGHLSFYPGFHLVITSSFCKRFF